MNLRTPPAPAVKTRAELESELAQDALRRGEDLLAQGDAAAALRWLDRAQRIAGDDATVALARGRALLALGDPAAEAALQHVAAQHDVREVWLGLALARTRTADWPGAAEALGMALSGHALPPGESLFGAAGRIAQAAGAAGWCGLSGDGSLVLRPAVAGAELEIRADGRRLRGGRAPDNAAEITVTTQGRALVGSPIQCARIRKVEGFVAVRDGGLEGWAWLPGDPDRDPPVAIVSLNGGGRLDVVASDVSMRVLRPLTLPRRFSVPAAALAAMPGPLRVTGPDGRDLTGSPLDPGQEIRAAAAAAAAVAQVLPVLGRRPRQDVPWLPMPASLPAAPANAQREPRRAVAVVVPVYRGLDLTMACLRAVFATTPKGTEVIVIDDASPEPALRDAVAALAEAGRVRLIRHRRNLGFPAAANAGLRAAAALAGGPDVLLLNSDTLPAPGWLARLRAVAHGAADIGTACPLSNDASILSYPDPVKPAKPPPPGELAQIGKRAGKALGDTCVDLPTAVGFCMYIRRECLLETGLLREDVFAQGYGEENDFCLRASRLGWRHVAVPGAYVAHTGGASFGAAGEQLRGRNIEVLERLHPGYGALIADFVRRDPLAAARRALDIARWTAQPRAPGGSAILITHDGGGGVERAIRARCAALAAEGLEPIVLRPVLDMDGTAERRYKPGLVRVDGAQKGEFPNLTFALPEDFAAFTALLAQAAPRCVELHHLLGHHPCVADLDLTLGVKLDVHVHDYSSICLQTNLIGTARRYCGEPDVAGCNACVAGIGAVLEEDIDASALRRRSAAQMARARRVVTPSNDAARRLRRYFPALQAQVEPHETDAALPPLAAMGGPPRRVGIVGGIGLAKGYDVLLACAEDAEARNLALSFTVIGHSEDDDRLLATGRVFLTGPYAERDAVALIREQKLGLAWLPSICPETWCYTLGEAMRAGLGVAVFDIGAQAERIRRTGRGWILPLGLPASAINNALLALQSVTGDVRAPAASDDVLSNLRSLPARS
jgi:GT2 family glycosyltransferase/glycosyltransferase involved in cell wall biosynthesis